MKENCMIFQNNVLHNKMGLGTIHQCNEFYLQSLQIMNNVPSILIGLDINSKSDE